MTVNISDFFKPLELKNTPLAEDYSKIQPFVKTAESFSQIAHQSIYIIDYYKRGFAYVSDNPLFLCGEKAASVLKQGYLFYLNHVPKTDLELLLEINKAGFKFYNNIPIEDRLHYMISYDFHLTQKDNGLLLINHRLTPLILDKKSNIWLALCIVSPASNNKSGNIIIRKKGEDQYYEYNLDQESWTKQTAPKIGSREKEILILSGQGLTMNQISKNLFITTDTIKFHKRNIFRKLKARNISEAILAASNYCII